MIELIFFNEILHRCWPYQNIKFEKKFLSKIILTVMTSSIVCADTCHFLGCLFVISYWLFPNILSVSDPNKVTLLKFRSKIDLSTVILSSFMPKMSKIKKVNFLRNFDHVYQSRAFKMVFLGLLTFFLLTFWSLTHHAEHE